MFGLFLFDYVLAADILYRKLKINNMRNIKELSRRHVGLTSFFSFQITIYNPGCNIFQGGLIRSEYANLRILLRGL